jgi:hypothetical protein
MTHFREKEMAPWDACIVTEGRITQPGVASALAGHPHQALTRLAGDEGIIVPRDRIELSTHGFSENLSVVGLFALAALTSSPVQSLAPFSGATTWDSMIDPIA